MHPADHVLDRSISLQRSPRPLEVFSRLNSLLLPPLGAAPHTPVTPPAKPGSSRLLHSRVIHGDATTVKLRVPGADRTRKAQRWATIGDAN